MRKKNPGKIIIAVPVAPPDTALKLKKYADDFICLHTPVNFGGVGQFYLDFEQVSDDEVMEFLKDAKREFKEETGKEISGKFFTLKPIVQKSRKLIYVWAVEKDFNPEDIVSNTFELEWPPKSGIKILFPEIDKAVCFNVIEAKEKILSGQSRFIDELLKCIQ